MGNKYENKEIDDIKHDIRQEFKKIEDSKRGFYRDDQEIYEAGENVISSYISQLSNADGMQISNEKWGVRNGEAALIKSENRYKNEALNYFRQAKENFSRKYNEVLKKEIRKLGIWITSSSENEEQIQQVAESINEAEENALKKIREYCNPKQERDNAMNNSNIARDKQGSIKLNQGEIVNQDPPFIQVNDGTLTFTKKANPLRIHQVLGHLFKYKGVIYTIDYSECKNPSIKNDMKKIINGDICLIKYDEKTQTYHLTDANGNILSNRALIWEGVKVKKVDNINQHDMNISSNENVGADYNGSTSLNDSHNTYEQYDLNANDYKYYLQYRDYMYKKENKRPNLCSAYAYGVVSDILTKQGYYFSAPNISAWEIASSRYIQGKFNIEKINPSNPKEDIINAPAGTFLTVRFSGTHATEKGVSHAMVSLGNGVYTDLFGSKIRTIDFKSQVKFHENDFYYGGSKYTLTDDARLISPNYKNLDLGSSKTIERNNITPSNFAEQIRKSTGLDMNYVRLLIARQNNISVSNFGKIAEKLSVNITEKEIKDVDIENKEGSTGVAEKFLNSIKEHKSEIMEYYPNLTNHEYDEIAKRAMGILYQESGAGAARSFFAKEGLFHPGMKLVEDKRGFSVKEKLIDPITEKLWKKKKEFSRGYTQIKFNDKFDKDAKKILENFGINSGDDFATNAEKCGIATMIALITDYFSFIVPMKTDPFRTNNARIINLTFNKRELNIKTGKIEPVKESIAFGKSIKINNETRPRTEDEIDAEIKKWGEKYGGIADRNEITRPGLSTDDDFFNMLYYTRNKQSEIYYGTATPLKNIYISQATGYINKHITDNKYTA